MPTYYQQDWFDLPWSEWTKLPRETLPDISNTGGVYRIRHSSDERDGLEYVGETGRTRDRIRNLSAVIYYSNPDKMPYRAPHTAGPCLWAIQDKYGPVLEVSFATSDTLNDKQYRKAVEKALIALYRREKGESPTANFARMIPGYKQSTYKDRDIIYRGGPLEEGETEPNTEPGVGPLPWKNIDDVTHERWMGIDWSEPYRLENRLDTPRPDVALYRIWYEQNVPPLAYIGETTRITDRLRGHEKTYGSNAFVTVAERNDLDARHKRNEVETDLIGAHLIATGEAPIAQFGNSDRLSGD